MKKVCIIGAGIGGLTAGALLTKQGLDVTLFEKEKMLGGRALSFKGSDIKYEEYKKLISKFNMNIAFSEPDLKTIFNKKLLDGYILDLGYHAIGGGVLSNLNNILSEFNEHINIIESRVGLIGDDGYRFPFLSKIDMIKILPNILRLLYSSEETMKRLDKVSMTKTIEKYGKGKMKLILEIFSRSITTVNNLDLISTGEMFRAQKNLYKGSKPVGYPKKGLGIIHDKLSKYIIQKNGKINTNTTVEKIIINKNKANGVIVNGKKQDFDIVISNILVQDLFSIIDKSYFPKDYVTNFKTLKGTGSLCAYYSLNKLDPYFIGKTFHFIERNIGVDGCDAVGMVDFMSSDPESNLSPKSTYLIQSYIICTPEEAKNKKILDKLRNSLDSNLKRLIPDYKSNLNWAIYPAIWHLDGVAKTIDNYKPEIITPIKYLYLIGDCVKAPGIGVNCSLNSAKMLRDIIVSGLDK